MLLQFKKQLIFLQNLKMCLHQRQISLLNQRFKKQELNIKNIEKEMKVDKMMIEMLKSSANFFYVLNEKDKYGKRQNNFSDDRGKLIKLYQEGVIDSDREYIRK